MKLLECSHLYVGYLQLTCKQPWRKKHDSSKRNVLDIKDDELSRAFAAEGNVIENAIDYIMSKQETDNTKGPFTFNEVGGAGEIWGWATEKKRTVLKGGPCKNILVSLTILKNISPQKQTKKVFKSIRVVPSAFFHGYRLQFQSYGT